MRTITLGALGELVVDDGSLDDLAKLGEDAHQRVRGCTVNQKIHNQVQISHQSTESSNVKGIYDQQHQTRHFDNP